MLKRPFTQKRAPRSTHIQIYTMLRMVRERRSKGHTHQGHTLNVAVSQVHTLIEGMWGRTHGRCGVAHVARSEVAHTHGQIYVDMCNSANSSLCCWRFRSSLCFSSCSVFTEWNVCDELDEVGGFDDVLSAAAHQCLGVIPEHTRIPRAHIASRLLT